MNPGKLKVNLNHIFMSYKSAETCHLVSFPSKGTNIFIFVTCGASFYLWVWSVQLLIQSLTGGWDVFTCKNVLCACSYVFYSHGCNVRGWNLFWANVAKPVLWQLMILLPCTLAPHYLRGGSGCIWVSQLWSFLTWSPTLCCMPVFLTVQPPPLTHWLCQRQGALSVGQNTKLCWIAVVLETVWTGWLARLSPSPRRSSWLSGRAMRHRKTKSSTEFLVPHDPGWSLEAFARLVAYVVVVLSHPCRSGQWPMPQWPLDWTKPNALSDYRGLGHCLGWTTRTTLTFSSQELPTVGQGRVSKGDQELDEILVPHDPGRCLTAFPMLLLPCWLFQLNANQLPVLTRWCKW